MKHLLSYPMALALLAAPEFALARSAAGELGASMAYRQMGSMARTIAADPQAFLDQEAKNDEAMQKRLSQIRQVLDNDEAKLKMMAEINAKSEAAGRGLVFDKDALAARNYDLTKNRASLKEIADYTSYRMSNAKDIVKDLQEALKGDFSGKTDFSNNDNYMLEHKLGVLNWTHAYDKRVVKNKFTMYYLEPVMPLLKPMNKKFPVGGAEIPKGEGLIDDISLAGDCAKVKVPADSEFLANFDRNYGTKDGMKILCEKGRKSFTATRNDDGETEVKIGYNTLPWPFRHAPDPKSMAKELRKASAPEASDEQPAAVEAPAAAEPPPATRVDQGAVQKPDSGSVSVDGTL